MLPDAVERLLEAAQGAPGPALWLTGAGISAESGVPTFRGEEGYWRVGSVNYHPTELATFEAFSRLPDEVWGWYLYRRGVCRAAAPNPAHEALAELERRTGDDFLLVTQNVDGLHLRAGNSLARTFQIHGNIDYMRCATREEIAPVPLPETVSVAWEKGRLPGDAERAALVCPTCGGRARPHVLWFDECYDEDKFRFDSSLRAAARCRLLVVVGTAGATNLPMQVGMMVARRRVPMIVVNPEPNPFSQMVEATAAGAFLQGTGGEWVPRLCERIASLAGGGA